MENSKTTSINRRRINNKYNLIKILLWFIFLILIFFSLSMSSPEKETWIEPEIGISTNKEISTMNLLNVLLKEKGITLRDCVVKGPFILKGHILQAETIKAEMNFARVKIREPIDWAFVCFEKPISFVACEFQDSVSIKGCSFNQKVMFGNCQFLKTTHFYASRFQQNTFFSKTTFHELSDFQEVFFRKTPNFLDTKFKKKCNFTNTVFNEKFFIMWDQVKSHLICDRFNCYKLMRLYESQRMLHDADGIYLFLKNQERMEKSWYIRYPEYWLIQLTCGYGVKPQNTLYVSLFIILLFAIFYTKSGAMRARTQDFAVRRAMRKAVKKVSFYHALYFSLQTFIIGVVTDWYPTEHYLIKIRRIRLLKFKTLAMMEGTLGWILVILFIISLGKKFIR